MHTICMKTCNIRKGVPTQDKTKPYQRILWKVASIIQSSLRRYTSGCRSNRIAFLSQSTQ